MARKYPIPRFAFPFVHHTMPLTATAKSYVEWIKLHTTASRVLQPSKITMWLFFNYPDGDTVALNVQNQSYYALVRDYGRYRVWNDKLIWRCGSTTG
jgi:signal peptidase I